MFMRNEKCQEKRYKGHSMYENTTTQYKNIYQEKKLSDPFAILACHPWSSLPTSPEKLKLQNFSTMLSRPVICSIEKMKKWHEIPSKLISKNVLTIRYHLSRVFPWYGLQRVYDGRFNVQMGRSSPWNLRSTGWNARWYVLYIVNLLLTLI